jgi:hypothetical protein
VPPLGRDEAVTIPAVARWAQHWPPISVVIWSAPGAERVNFDHDAARSLFSAPVPRRDPPRERPRIIAVASVYVIGWGTMEFTAAAGALLILLWAPAYLTSAVSE